MTRIWNKSLNIQDAQISSFYIYLKLVDLIYTFTVKKIILLENQMICVLFNYNLEIQDDHNSMT